MGGHKPKAIRDKHRAWLLERIGVGDFTLRGLVSELAARGLKVDYRTVWSFVHAEKLSFKKTVVASERDRPDIARRRAQWAKYQGRIDPSRLVFIDETWTKTNMAPLRGWAPRGSRLTAGVPHGHWKTMTFLAALRHDRIDAPWLLDGPINGASFLTYVETTLLPTLRPGDIIRRAILPLEGSPIPPHSWTISAATRAKPSARRSDQRAQSCSSCRNIRPT